MKPFQTPSLPPLVGAKEATAILGIQKMTLKRWLEPGSAGDGPGFQPGHTYLLPPQRVSAGPIWVRADIERFRDEIGRQRAPKSEG
jgi:hypothetical protein